MLVIDFIKQAPCRDADPWLFDQYQLDLAQPGLEYCKGCPFWEMCESRVEPSTSSFDGICGGKVWRWGNILARLSPDEPHRLIVTPKEERVNEPVAIRGSKLLGN